MRAIAFILILSAAGCGGPAAPTPAVAVSTPAPAPPPPAPPEPRWKPDALTDADYEKLAPSYPEPLRGRLTARQLFDEVDRSAWAFTYTGGPVRLWLECDEVGQQTYPKRYPSGDDAWMTTPPDSGRVLLAFGGNVLPRAAEIARRAGKSADTASTGSKLVSLGANGGAATAQISGTSELWAGWPGGQAISAGRPTVPATVGNEPVVLLEATAVELNPPAGSPPRKVTLHLVGAFGPVVAGK